MQWLAGLLALLLAIPLAPRSGQAVAASVSSGIAGFQPALGGRAGWKPAIPGTEYIASAVPAEPTAAPTVTPTAATPPAATTTVTPDVTAPATATVPYDPTGSLASAVTPGPIGAAPLDAGTDDAAYVADVTVPDGTVVAPGAHFTKTWEIENTGTHAWTMQYHWTFEAGAPMGSVRSVASVHVAPGGTATFSVEMVAPQRPGRYRGYWQMTDATGNVFGAQAWVAVQVQAATTATPSPTLPVPTVLPQPSPSPTATPSPTPTPIPWFGPAVGRAFFAEGYTGPGYQEYLTFFNPQTRAARIQLTVYRADGASLAVPLRLPGLTRRTLDLNAVVPRSSTALKVEADGPIVVERAQYTANGHVVAGAPLPSRHWYLAEGYVGHGFQDGLRLFNPGVVAAAVTIRSYRSNGVAFVSHRTLPGETRLNVQWNDIALSGASSLDLSSSVPVVVEGIVSGPGSSGASAAMALPAPSRQWYFPDGGTSSGNQEYVALFNTSAATSTVHLQVVASGGALRPYTLHIRPHSRGVYVLHGLLKQPGLAAVVQSDRAVVAQEVRYSGSGGVSVVDGASTPVRRWALAEGYVGHGFKEWITLLNPGAKTSVVRVQVLAGHGYRRTLVLRARAHHRDYVDLNGLVPIGQVAAVITANRPIVAGRTMIFNGGKGLSTTVGVPLTAQGT